MSDPIEDGGQAFPVPASEYNDRHEGMTLRDWFAGQALAGLMARAGSENFSEDLRANIAIRQANAMIAARKEESK